MSTTGLSLPAAPQRAPEFGGSALIVCDSLVRIYQSGSIEVQALQGLDLLVQAGEMIAVVGASGSGKSTLLSLLAGVDAPTAGRARVANWDLMTMTRADRVRYRRHTVGFVGQQASHNLVPYLNARQMVDLPMTLARVPRRQRAERVEELLTRLGVRHCADRRPAQMSGGEQTRVAIGMALANSPKVLLADEPTGSLDTSTSAEVLATLQEVNRDLGVTVVIVTHDPDVSARVARTVAIRDGRTSSELLRRANGDSEDVAEEFAVMDRAGRVQIPKDYREALEMTRRVRLALEADHVGVHPTVVEES